jgi:hypothetical protein
MDAITGEEITIEPEVNFFVKALESNGAIVRFTCGGHPFGFSIVFDASYDIAHVIEGLGYFQITLMRIKNRFHLSLKGNERGIFSEKHDYTDNDRDQILRSASLSWVQNGFNIH